MKRVVIFFCSLLGLHLAACSQDVAGPNRAPVAVVFGDLEIPPYLPVTLDGSRSFDPDGDSLVYSWRMLATEASLSEFTLEDANKPLARFSSSLDGEHWIQLVVDDGKLESEAAVIRVRVLRACAQDAECDDHNVCNGLETCEDGVCQAGTPPDCDDHNPCTLDGCDPDSGCRYTDNIDPCDDGDPCTMNDACDQGACSGVPLDADEDGYADIHCGGTDCDDANGQIHPGIVEGPEDHPYCSDGVDNDCDGQTDENDTGCRSCVNPGDCNDNNVCNGLEDCVEGLCVDGTALDCDDENPCTDDCDPDLGCGRIFNTEPCDDGDPCSTNDICGDGSCRGVFYDCGDPNPCTDDICLGDGTCEHLPNTGAFCNDGDTCTMDDACSVGQCEGSPLDADGDGQMPTSCGGLDCDDDPNACGAACFDGNLAEDGCDGYDQNCDGKIDEDCHSCEAGQAFCDADGRTLHICNAEGSGFDENNDISCGWFCHNDACAEPSNMDHSIMNLCDGNTLALRPAGGDVIYDGSGLTCDQNCDSLGTTNTIPALNATTVSGVTVICLSDMNLPEASSLRYEGRDLAPLILLVTGDATVAGVIHFDGQAPASSTVSGIGGPGGGDGAEECSTQSCNGLVGEGVGGGGGGLRLWEDAAGGGGGGGHAGSGGSGGDADSESNGGDAGIQYGSGDIQPLVGGSGGGSGGDGKWTTGSGPGGGAGGAFQMTVRGRLNLRGEIRAKGGQGYEQAARNGAGGGGSGGAILLEAHHIEFDSTPSLSVEGGDGGAVGTNFATGASGSEMDGEHGVDSSGAGGGGGGGGSGRVRLNAVTGATCQNTSPAGACSASSL
ncbi:MAG: hypothetical protein JRF33_02945 [Deltaproteobacteria bacterium]|nr:hypothetical protein [Deltaproteobacteria bacterium]